MLRGPQDQIVFCIGQGRERLSFVTNMMQHHVAINWGNRQCVYMVNSACVPNGYESKLPGPTPRALFCLVAVMVRVDGRVAATATARAAQTSGGPDADVAESTTAPALAFARMEITLKSTGGPDSESAEITSCTTQVAGPSTTQVAGPSAPHLGDEVRVLPEEVRVLTSALRQKQVEVDSLRRENFRLQLLVEEVLEKDGGKDVLEKDGGKEVVLEKDGGKEVVLEKDGAAKGRGGKEKAAAGAPVDFCERSGRWRDGLGRYCRAPSPAAR